MAQSRIFEAPESTSLLTEVFDCGSNDSASRHAIQRERGILFAAIRQVIVLYAACRQAVVVTAEGRSLVVSQGTFALLRRIVEQAKCLAGQGSSGPGSHRLVSLKLLVVLV
jgi:hypothetical protein